MACACDPGFLEVVAGGVDVQAQPGLHSQKPCLKQRKKLSFFLLSSLYYFSQNKYLYVTYTFSRFHNFNMTILIYYFILFLLLLTLKVSLLNNFSTLLANILLGFIHKLLIYQIMPFRVTFIRFLSSQKRMPSQEHKARSQIQESLGNQPVDCFYFRKYR